MKVSMNGVCDMHVHTNPDLRLRAYDDFELADAAIRVALRENRLRRSGTVAVATSCSSCSRVVTVLMSRSVRP